jgi:hypothetical protein
VEIEGDHGWVPIHLERRGSGYVGPRGEYYSRVPERSELERTYGRTPASYTAQSTKPASGETNEQRFGMSVEKGNGEVTLYRPNRSPLRIRTEGSLVKEWRVNSDGSLSVLSHSSGGESVVQNFSPRDGRQRDRVLARDIRDGRPAWAAAFEGVGGGGAPTTTGSNEQRFGMRVEKGNGEVTLYHADRSPLRIRTEGSLVKEWRVNADGSLSVLSHSSGREAVVQNFSPRDGRERHRVMAADIGSDAPEWAAGFGPGHTTSADGFRAENWAGTSVQRAPGEVTVTVPGRGPMRIRTEGSVVKEWRVNERDGTIGVLSLVPGSDPVAQSFSLRDGRQRDRILARDIRNGRPAWAADFQRAGSGNERISQPMATLRVTDPVRDGKTKGPRVTVAGNSLERSVRVSIWDERSNRVVERDVPTQNGYWNTQVPLEPGRYRLRAEGQSGRDREEFSFTVR